MLGLRRSAFLRVLVASAVVVSSFGCERILGRDGERSGEGSSRSRPNSGVCRPTPVAEERGPRPPNIVLVTICSLRPSHMGMAGYERPTTPNLDRLASQSVVFENAVASSSWTKPAVASILTGLTPNVHGLTDYYSADDVESGRVTPKRVLADEVGTLAECLRDGGYETIGRVNNVHAGPFYGLDQGFDDYASDRSSDTSKMLGALETALASRALDAAPFFYFLMTKDAHSPYQPELETLLRFDRVGVKLAAEELPQHSRDLWQLLNRRMRKGEASDAATRRHLVDLYDAGLADLDAALAALPAILAEAGVLDETIVAVIGDHGERFFEKASRGGVGHGHFLDQATLHVPLFFRIPGEAPRTVSELARSIDLLPTLAARASLQPVAPLPGRDLLAPAVESAAAAGTAGAAAGAPPPGAFASFKEREHMLRLGLFSVYRRPDGREELYASRRWQRGERPLPVDAPAAAAARQALDDWLAFEAAEREQGVLAPLREVPEDVAEELRALGYVD